MMSSIAAAVCRITRRRVFARISGGGGWDISAYVSTDRWFHGHLLSSIQPRDFRPPTEPSSRVVSGLGRNGEVPLRMRRSLETEGSSNVGRLLPHKGVSDLIAALPEGMSLDIVGPAPNGVEGSSNDRCYYEQLKEQARGKRVRFRHDCDDRLLIEAYRRAMCVVLPSVYRAPDGTETKVPELPWTNAARGDGLRTPVNLHQRGEPPEIVAHDAPV